jgi:hypothetical protein
MQNTQAGLIQMRHKMFQKKQDGVQSDEPLALVVTVQGVETTLKKQNVL